MCREANFLNLRQTRDLVVFKSGQIGNVGLVWFDPESTCAYR